MVVADQDHPDADPGQGVSLYNELYRLDHISLRLRLIGRAVALLSLLNLGSLAFLGLYRSSRIILPISVIYGDLMTMLLLATGVGLAFTCLIMFESLKKQGDALFEEISDELQWSISSKSEGDRGVPSPANPPANQRPDLKVRIALRSFARTTDLPLAPGQFGPHLRHDQHRNDYDRNYFPF